MPTETRQCLACGVVEETKRSLDYSLPHAGCGGQLVKKREYDRHKSTAKVH